jgi:hypothetical protein
VTGPAVAGARARDAGRLQGLGVRAAKAGDAVGRRAEGDADPLGRLVVLEPVHARRLVGTAPDIQARRARQDDERHAGPEKRRGLGRGALEAAHLGDAAGEAQRDVMAPQLVPEPPAGDLLVDRLAGEDRAHGLGAHLGGAAHHALALGPVGVHQHAGDPVDVGEQERGALILGDQELGGVGDALRQGLRPDVPEPRVPEPVRAQEHREREPAAHKAAYVLRGVGRHDQRVGSGAELVQPQDLVDVALDARSRLLAQVVVARGELGHVRDQMVGQAAGELRRARQELGGQRAHRRRHAALLGALGTGRRQGAHLEPIVLRHHCERSPASSRAIGARHARAYGRCDLVKGAGHD